MATTDITAKAKKVAQEENVVAEKSTKSKKPIVPKDIDINQYVTVKNGFQGTLVYESPRTHEVYLWEGFGAEQEMELRELKNAKSASKKFFENNWFMFDKDDEWIIDYLGVGQYYKNALSLDDFDEIFTKQPSELSDIISKLSPGQQRSVIYRAAQLIKAREIDSIRVIETLEKALGVRLIERE